MGTPAALHDMAAKTRTGPVVGPWQISMSYFRENRRIRCACLTANFSRTSAAKGPILASNESSSNVDGQPGVMAKECFLQMSKRHRA